MLSKCALGNKSPVQQLDQKSLFKHQTINSWFHFKILWSQTSIKEHKCFIPCQPKNTMDKPPSSFRLHLCDVFKRLFPSGWKHTLVVFSLTINTQLSTEAMWTCDSSVNTRSVWITFGGPHLKKKKKKKKKKSHFALSHPGELLLTHPDQMIFI